AGPRRARRGRRDGLPPARRRPPAERPDMSKLPKDPGVYVFRDARGRPLYVGKSVSLRTRARAHFCAPAGWTERAEVVDYKATNSELGALVLENRLIKEWRPAGNRALKRTDGWVYLRCRLDIPFPVLEVAREPAPGHAVNVGPLKGKDAAEELADQLNSLFLLRRCGRKLKLRPHASAYGQMGRCLSPCLGDLDPNLYRSRLDEALGLFGAGGDAGESLLAMLERHMREASEARHYERAGVLQRRIERLSVVLGRLGGVLRATHACSRLVLARHPVDERFDAFWIVGGRVLDWGPLPDDLDDVAERTDSALARVRSEYRRPRVATADEADEVRIVGGWLAAHEPPQLELDPALDPGEAVSWVERSTRAPAAAAA
ncbi:MAG: hypothetical protein ACJ77M_07365, partial [Thermoleophilaceae bacterium]